MKKYEEALKVAEEGLVLSIGLSPFYEKDFAHRLERLKRKIKGAGAIASTRRARGKP
jgi:hypothetical protein